MNIEQSGSRILFTEDKRALIFTGLHEDNYHPENYMKAANGRITELPAWWSVW